MKAKAGLIDGPKVHYLDHLAPLCSLENIPLILTDEKLAFLAEKFYPDLEVIHFDPFEAPEKLVLGFDTIYCSTPRVLFDQVFYFAQAMHNKRIKTIWCPHGNSDKGRNSPWMEVLKDEELLLTYGQRMENFLREKGVNVPMKRIGNYRLAYYERHQDFYDRFLPPKVNPTLLYAPTWQDSENNSSFPKFWKFFLEIPDDFEVMVKLHPNLYDQYPDEIEILKSKIDLIEDFPPIYPLLARTDVYVGDKSSIGYDFMAYNRPMITLDNQTDVFEACRKALNAPVDWGALYEETFVVKRIYI